MVEFKKSPLMGTLLRTGPWNDIGIPITQKIKAAIEADKMDEALELVEYLLNPSGGMTGGISLEYPFRLLWWWINPEYIANKSGEAEIEKALRATIPSWLKGFHDKVKKMEVEERVQVAAELKRTEAPFLIEKPTKLSVIESAERYELIMDPCGYAMQRRNPVVKEFQNFHLFVDSLGSCEKAYPWTWGIQGVSYRCLRCCMMNEILPIEWDGYPLWITDYRQDPNEPCRWLIYKKPDLIPEEFYTRVGKKKPQVIAQ